MNILGCSLLTFTPSVYRRGADAVLIQCAVSDSQIAGAFEGIGSLADSDKFFFDLLNSP
jgi:hypothetical protein